MAKNVDFKSVASEVRYGILGSFKMMTPSEFKELSEPEKVLFYERIFQLHHDCCNFLTSYLDIDDIKQDYGINE